MNPGSQPFLHRRQSFAPDQIPLRRDRKTNTASGQPPSQAQDIKRVQYSSYQPTQIHERGPPSAQQDSSGDWTQVELPFYAELFRPRWPRNLQSLVPDPVNSQAGAPLLVGGDRAVGWCENDPVPCAESAEHASQIFKALNDFHVAVALVGDTHDPENRNALLTMDDGQSERYMQRLREIVGQAMPTFRKLNVRKDQVVFFYHGRGDIKLGNLLWEVMMEEQHDMQVVCDNQATHGGPDQQPAPTRKNESITNRKEPG